jgi:DNA-binding NtrC family response regulator
MSTFLIVDDDCDLRLLISRKLENEFNAETTLAHSGRSSAEMLLSKHFNLVVSDFRMPDGSGAWLHDFMKNQTPEIPLILFSSCSRDELPSEDTVLKARISKSNVTALVAAIHSLGVGHAQTSA